MSVADRTLDWLAPHLEDVPSDLAGAVRDCVRRAPEEEGATVPGLLAEAATRELERVLELPQSREAAIRLLAADASLTYAFQAAAELGHDVTQLAEAVGIRGRIGRRLAPSPGRDPEET